MSKILISIIIPAYNEEESIGKCLFSLMDQSYKHLEIIVIDDGSTDKTLKIISNFQFQTSNFKVLQQNHKGPGPARNLGASKAKGEILVFVDADMTFDKDFIRDLAKPILESKTIGTFSKNEMVSTKDNPWSICWKINRNVPNDQMLPVSYPNEAPVFRAIVKKGFDRVGGFDTTGEYTDDWSLSRKLGIKSTVASGAIYYHANPASLGEVWPHARWIGKNEFIAGNLIRKLRSLLVYSLPVSLCIGILKSQAIKPHFLIFKLVYDNAVWWSVVKSFLKET